MREAGDQPVLTKDAIRVRIRAQRQAHDAAWVARTSGLVAARVLDLPEFVAAGTVFGYLAMAGEVQTQGILDACWQRGKQVCVPAYDAPRGRYAPARLGPADELRPGHWQVLEPAQVAWVDDARIDLAVVPALAFDLRGGRIGHGVGYYDRILAELKGRLGFKLGIGFEFQMVAAVPVDAHDVRMDAVVTEEAVYRTTR